MSLQVWLPLNGDLHNQGLRQNLNIIGTNITFSNNGKIGKCADFNGTSSRIYIPNFSIDNQWSYGCWVNTPTSDTRGWELVIILNNSGSDADSQLAFWIHQKENRIESLANTKYTSTIPYTPYYNSWHHFFATYNGTVLTSYIDGTIVKTQTITDEKYTGTNLTIGARCTAVNGSSFSSFFQGSLNDIRIYNHCLSAKEVEEISKGLVLHYQLNDTINIKDTANLLGQEKSEKFVNVWGSYGFGSTGVLSIANINPAISGETVLVTNNGDNGKAGEIATSFGNSIMNKGDSITVSAYVKGNGATIGKTGTIHMYNTNGTNTQSTGKQFTFTDKWQRVFYTLTWTYDNPSNASGNMYIYCPRNNGESFYVSNCQAERGTTPTVFTTGSRIGNKIIYDSSGYNNNGQIIGLLETIVPSPKYHCSTYINSPDPTTNSATGEYYISANCSLITPSTISISWWSYPESGYNGNCSNGIWSTTANDIASDYQVSAFNHRDNGFDVNSSDGTHLRLSSSSFVANAWHHYVVTYDGQTAKLYKDGVQQSSIAFTTAKTLGTFTKILIGHSRAGGVHRKVKGKYLDFRVYVTALTEAQVKELYRTSMNIDGTNILPRDLE